MQPYSLKKEPVGFLKNLNDMKTIQATVTMTFGGKDGEEIDLQTNDIPKSLIIEALQNLTKMLAQELVKEATEEVPQSGVNRYLQGRIDQDRVILKGMLK